MISFKNLAAATDSYSTIIRESLINKKNSSHLNKILLIAPQHHSTNEAT